MNSYRKVARVLSETPADLAELSAAGRLTDLPGVGKGTAERIDELLATGALRQLADLRGQLPDGLIELLNVQGLGPKTVGKLWKQAAITGTDALRKALASDRAKLEAVEGLGAKKLDAIAESLAFADASADRFRLDEAEPVAMACRAVVAEAAGDARVDIAGSYRRWCETVGDIDVLCQAPAARAKRIIDAFCQAGHVTRVLAQGKTKGSVIVADSIQADLRVVPAKSFGAALQYFTGSKAHNVALRELAVKAALKLNEYGLFEGDRSVAGETEQEVYAALDLPFIPPELREDRGELDAAAEGKLPELLGLDDIRGDLHMHTMESDGVATIE